MLLPSEYQEVEYIQSSGDGTNSGQYIDIGYSFQNNKGRISMKYSPIDFGSSWSGKRATGSYNSTRSIYVYGNYSSFYIGMGSNDINTGYTMTTGTDYEVDIAADNGNYTLSYNGNTSSGTYSSTIVNNRTLSIFSAHVSDSGANEYNYRSSMKLYYYKLWDNGVLQRDLVPCYRKQDSVIGLYDLVNNQFYTNSGTGTFTKGADVNGYKIKRVLTWVNGEEKQIYPAGWNPGANTLAYFPLEGDYNDYSGNGNNGTKSGTISFVTSGGLTYAETSSYTAGYVSFPITMNSTAYTLSGWVNLQLPSQYYRWRSIFGIGNVTNSLCGTDVGGGYHKFDVTVVGTRDGISSVAPSASTWYHIAGIFTTTGMKMYVNGVQAYSDSYSYTLSGSSGKLFSRDALTSGDYHGALSQIIIEDKEWTQQEVSEYYNLTKGNYGL